MQTLWQYENWSCRWQQGAPEDLLRIDTSLSEGLQLGVRDPIRVHQGDQSRGFWEVEVEGLGDEQGCPTNVPQDNTLHVCELTAQCPHQAREGTAYGKKKLLQIMTAKILINTRCNNRTVQTAAGWYSNNIQKTTSTV